MFNSIMKYEDFIHMSVPGDGACFFHSLAQILTLEGDPIPSNQTMKQTEKNRNTLAKKLRKECVDWLENNLDYEIAQIGMTIEEEIKEDVRHCNDKGCGNYKNVKEYLTYMRKNKAYAGQIEIYAMSYYLGRSIRVYIRDKGKFKSSGLGFMIGLKHDPMDDIHIYHNIGESSGNNEHHFEPLYPKVKAKKEVKQITKKKETEKKETKKKETKKKETKKKETKKTRPKPRTLRKTSRQTLRQKKQQSKQRSSIKERKQRKERKKTRRR